MAAARESWPRRRLHNPAATIEGLARMFWTILRFDGTLTSAFEADQSDIACGCGAPVEDQWSIDFRICRNRVSRKKMCLKSKAR